MNQMTAKQSQVWKRSDEIKVGAIYSARTRNHDASVRAAFKRDCDTAGTEAWGICMMMRLARSPLAEFTDDVCDQILSAVANI